MKDLIREKWGEILQKTKEDSGCSDISYKTWLSGLEFYDIDENIIIVIVTQTSLGDNSINFVSTKYGIFLKYAIADLLNEDFEIKFVLPSYIKSLEKKNSSENNSSLSGNIRYLKPEFTFENFVVGPNNDSAFAASNAVAESPGTVFNPLFIYGGSGLGKTHLMYAIANFISQNNPDLKVLYVTSETYTNDLVEALRIKGDSPEAFRQKYRNNDVLLIDDIQFIIGKDRTQEEFFHTFNEMRDSNRQIIISSDKPPRDMKILDERIRSRLEWGLTVDIQPPSYEIRLAILVNKAKTYNINIPQDVLVYIATNIKSSVRELEGALQKLIALSRLMKREINIDLVVEALKDVISPDEKKSITPEIVVDIVAEHYNITSTMIYSKNKSKNISYPRQIAMYLCKTLTTASLNDIGRILGGRDHTTIIHGCNKISDDLKEDLNLQKTIDTLIKKINPPD